MSYLIDTIILIFLFYLAVSGWLGGFARTLIGPLSLALSIGAGTIYFHKTHNALLTFGIITFSPILIGIVFSVLLFLWNKTIARDKPISSLSRTAGCILNFAWGVLIASLFLTFVAMLPIEIPWMREFKNGVLNTFSYTLIKNPIKNKVPYINNLETLLKVTKNPEQMTAIQATPEFDAVYSSQKIQEALTDEECARLIKSKDILKLMTNPKIQAIFQDQDLLRKMAALSARMTQENSPSK
ncbi:MAG TPA: CvpA family protein [Candidatus Omnitrophota bacterium]|nr:CvpA family protein [Candidatus Omnitrophota bacterium]HPD84458.1 CvpA family protein [Candidatus Omnitrophota bacterium]HRZ03316.1 CvpA family protein [Candidatus Omnitrophota bacterium]